MARQTALKNADSGSSRATAQNSAAGRKVALRRQQMAEMPGGDAHAEQVEQRGGGAENPDGQELAPDDLLAAGRTDEQRLHRAALLLAGAQIDGGIQRSRQRPHDEDERKDAREHVEQIVGGAFARRFGPRRVAHLDHFVVVGRQALPQQPHRLEMVFPAPQDRRQTIIHDPRTVIAVAGQDVEERPAVFLQQFLEIRRDDEKQIDLVVVESGAIHARQKIVGPAIEIVWGSLRIERRGIGVRRRSVQRAEHERVRFFRAFQVQSGKAQVVALAEKERGIILTRIALPCPVERKGAARALHAVQRYARNSLWHGEPRQGGKWTEVDATRRQWGRYCWPCTPRTVCLPR